MKITPSEEFIQELFLLLYGINLEKLDEYDGRTGKTSDFEYTVDGHRIFVCELKEFLNLKPTVEDGWKITIRSENSFIYYRVSNATSRISHAINKAYRQLCRYTDPKILIFLNHSPFLDVSFFQETYRGYRVMLDEDDNPVYDVYARKASKGVIRTRKKEIDLYIWIDLNCNLSTVTTHNVSFMYTGELGKQIYSSYFSKL